MSRASFIRRSLAGTALVAISLLTICGMAAASQRSTDTEVSQPTTSTEVTSTECTTTSTTTNSTTSSTTTSVTTTTTMAETILMIQPTVVNPTTAVQIESTTVWVEPEPTWASEDDIILLAKLINHEASASYDGKVMVGSCVVNRMNAKGMSVAGVIYEPNQFTTAYSLTTYTDADYQAAQQVLTQGSADTRIYFFNGAHPDCKNWFYDINYNYLGAW